MKWDCGETRQERVARLTDWHPWFAWRPIQVASHDCRWLEVIERKGSYHRYFGIVLWEYRAKPESAE